MGHILAFDAAFACAHWTLVFLSTGSIQPSPRPITYQQLVHQGAKEGWYQVSGGFLDLNRRVRCPGNDEGDSYLALRGLGETASSPVHVLVQENNADIDNRINRINGKPANTYTSDAAGNIIAQKPIFGPSYSCNCDRREQPSGQTL